MHGHDGANAITVKRATPNIQTGTEQVTRPRINEMPNTSVINQATYFQREFAGNPPFYKPQITRIEATNRKLVTNLARQNLPKCHPDIFHGDPTLFHPWKKSFEATIQDADLIPTKEMSYLRNYTGGKVQALLDNFLETSAKRS